MYIELGKIVGVWGVKGWVKLHSYTRNRPDIANYKAWRLSRNKSGPEGTSGGSDLGRDMSVLHCRQQAKGIVAQLEGIQDRDAAASLIGMSIWVKKSDLPTLPKGQYYWQELIGLSVSNSNDRLGSIVSIMETGAHDVLVCKPFRKELDDIDAVSSESRALNNEINDEATATKGEASIVEGEASITKGEASTPVNTDILIPYNDQVVLSVNLDEGTMLVDWDPSYLAD